ncbi:hypothetical protein RND71_043627 [Anisodus tanguticus]|uniref:Papilin n=1 Tax=Anisodus tanguticus TaxID=243964 RepID=A0AAE1QNA7_9SOLA|nr:hypothetical protein RND71_043627 [Anisodus tanguticus]
MALLEAVELYGFGNWNDISSFIGSKTTEEVKDHFITFYVYGNIGKNTWDVLKNTTLEINDHTCEDDRPISPSFLSNLPDIKSIEPIQQQQLGYMPKRDDFEREFDNEAESEIGQNGQNHLNVQENVVPVGCDNVLGSPRVEDKCGVCGGDGTTCHVLHGVYDNDNLKTGYNDLFTIPAGATNIKIEEIIPTTNYLAIKSIKGNYYLNGNWKIEFPRSMKFAGTVFNYVRKANAQYGAEYLTSTGPTNEPLIVDLLYQEKNRGIMYEYAVKKNNSIYFDLGSTTNEVEQAPRLNFSTNYPFQQYHSQFQYHWWTGDWTPCNKRCSGGQQQRRVLCLKLKENNLSKNSTELPKNSEIVHEQYCESRFKPTLIQSCNTHVCPPTWQAGHWSKCICDKNIKIRSVYCKKGALHSETGRPVQDSWVITDDEECNISRSINRKPKTVKNCEENEGCSDLNSINTSNTTENQSELEEKKNYEIDDIIDELATIPPLRICETKYAYQWFTSNWTEAAEGLNFKGCEMTLRDDCEESNFGCCQDGKSIAFGPFQYGCILDCSKTIYGCCHDNFTIALGSNYEGCAPLCQSTKFGCCANNSTAIDENKSNCLETEIVKNIESECEIYEDIIEGSGDEIEGSGSEIEDSKQKKKCKKKAEKSCSETVYGCCSDNKTIALDDKKTNCAKVQLCNSSAFGCCPDNVTLAVGINFEGCNLTIVKKETCEFTEFGCCPDNFTPARGAENYGCEGCAMHKFGCCSDGVTIATGENQQGCGCTTTLHGCCLDGITPASGPNLEGCNDCKTTKYGCCNDGKTPARGLTADNQLDCPCESTAFGCCPDRITSSKGPEYSGCPCSSLLHGCCPDGITSATGPRFEGCDCQRSPHGCCSDGKTVAYGSRFLGCPDGPSLDVQFNGHACSLPKERGKCRNFTVKWFFDQTYGGCSRFWYGGCEGNGNQFISQDECERSCMKPIGSNSCQLPLVKGPCEQDKRYWGYNSQRHVCEEFTYGGCLGNNNRFETREMCEDTCFYSENNDPCEQPIKPGNCGGNHQRYYYNKIIHKCQPFVYTGCQGNNNNFGSELECKNRCEARTAREICVLPVSSGTCLGKYPRYYFDYNTGVCREFMYTGCEGNNNRFVDKFSCERLCNTTLPYYKAEDSETNRKPYYTPNRLIEEDKKKSDVAAVLATLQHICNNNKDPGNCEESTIKWWFNPTEKKCESFYWSGCGGNNNRFDSKNDCESRCVSQLNGYIKLHQDLLLRQQMKILEEQKQLQKQKLLEQNVIRQNICLQPRETGNCYNFIERFYYDRDDKKCHRFYFSGCNGNDNNFESFEECTHRCGSPLFIANESNDKNLNPSLDHQNTTFKTEDCFLPSEHGPCDNDEPKWFYDSSDGICKQFYYGGCGGNNNRFENGRECQTKCWNSQNICILPQVKGPCNGNFSQWYYDKETSECKEFSYGGCQGNGNRFSSKEMCLEACSQNSQNNYQFNLIDHSHTNKKASDICHLKPEKGDGYQYLENYYYDPVQNICKMFIYSGSGGNKNRFEKRLVCESQCVDGHKLEVPEPTENDNKYEVCLKPSDKGLCYQSMARWYYDPNSFTCLTFVYTGCGGNLNKFLTYDNCIKFCAGVKPKLDDESSFILPSTTTISPSTTHELTYSQPTPPPSPTFEERPPQPEDCPVEDCSQRCVFGIDNYVDNRGCRRCRCSHPCHIHNCPNGFRCAVEVYRTEQGQPLVQPVCRLLNKPGECPMPSVLNQLSGPFKDCQDRCRVDADCRGTDKCCNNGCANICFNLQPSLQNKNDAEESDKVKVLAKLNERVILNCGSLPAKTEVSVAWLKDNKSVLQQLAAIENRLQILNNGSLLIHNLSVDDSGDYSCSYAKRETSELVTKVRELEVYEPVSILYGPKQVIATPNQYAILECNARGLPKPTITWWKDKKMLPTSSNKYTQNLENYQLKINSVSNSDAGVYYCQAHNDHGPIKVWDILLKKQQNIKQIA